MWGVAGGCLDLWLSVYIVMNTYLNTTVAEIMSRSPPTNYEKGLLRLLEMSTS